MSDEQAEQILFDSSRHDLLSSEELEAVNAYVMRVLGCPWRKYVVRKSIDSLEWPTNTDPVEALDWQLD